MRQIALLDEVSQMWQELISWQVMERKSMVNHKRSMFLGTNAKFIYYKGEKVSCRGRTGVNSRLFYIVLKRDNTV
ncbi:MAG TPA: hypothetical protein DCQ89_01365 [Psychrobacter sp.]|nr:hypothetical protein [Psychrobacter sp.]